jgi:hypothetical protein
MHMLKKSIALVVATFISGSAVHAALLSESRGPAELPPSSYTGKQFVDSRGCVFIRAGSGNAVTWVARVTRNRELICGYQPTFKSGASVAAKPKKKATRTTASSAAKPGQPMETIASTTKPPQVVKPKTKGKTAQIPKTAAPKTVAPAAVTQPTSAAKKTRVVAAPKAQAKTGAPQTVRVAKTSTARVATPRAVPALKVPEPRLPAGYQSVWTDGRLNPERGIRTAHGDATMGLVWSETVPRKLLPENGQDATLSQVHRRLLKSGGTTTGTKTVPKGVASRVAKKKTVRVAAIAPVAKTKGAATGRYIQVAAFGVSNNAHSTAQKFMRLGLPVVLREQTYKGRALNVVFLGPFAGNADLRSGLRAAKSQGFSDAFIK